jgi:hypothetical protein
MGPAEAYDATVDKTSINNARVGSSMYDVRSRYNQRVSASASRRRRRVLLIACYYLTRAFEFSDTFLRRVL